MFIDFREKNIVILNRLKELGIEYETKKLSVGDYIWNGYCIERKSINDFLNSILSGRIYSQLDSMIAGLSLGAERAILIIHGNTKEINRRYFTDTDFYSALGKITVEYPNVCVYFLPNETAVANFMASMYYKTYNPDQPCYEWVKKTKDSTFNVLRAANFSIRQAKELQKHYTLEEIFSMPEKDLKALKYIGVQTAKKFISMRKKSN